MSEQEVRTTDIIIDPHDKGRKKPPDNQGVLVIYTGGTIGSAPMDSEDPDSPLIAVKWEKLREFVSKLQSLPFPVDAISFEDALDSSNVGPKHWRTIAEIINTYHDNYEGFVVVHGTDTMVYTASALSFILKNLDKPVIMTGSQLSAIDNVRNDGEQNLITSIVIACPSYSKIPLVPEVCIFFRDQLLRGNRTRKVDASGYAGFESPNCQPLGTAGDRIEINANLIRRKPEGAFRIQPTLNTSVITFDIFPGLQDNVALVQRILQTSEDLKGVVLRTYGAGNMPTDDELIQVLQEAISEQEIAIVNVTQCLRGEVEQGLYDTSAALQDIGIISGQDMTPEAALCKLMELTGDPDVQDDPELIREAMTRNIAGELTHSIYYTDIDRKERKLDSADEEIRLRLPARALEGFSEERIHRVLIRFIGAQLLNIEDGKALKIGIYINLGAAEPLDPNRLAVELNKTKLKGVEKQTFTFDITQTQRQLEPRTSFTITIDERSVGTLRWEKVEVALYVDE